MFMGSTDTADVHIQGSAVASHFIKMHKGALQGHSTCIVFGKNSKQSKHSAFFRNDTVCTNVLFIKAYLVFI